MVRFIHAADIHLDSNEPRGLVPYEGAPVEDCREATRRALENLVRLAIAERVDLLLIAGDIYDGNWKDTRTGLFFVGQLRKLREAGIRVYMIRGNHDAASEISRSLLLPDNVDGTPMLLSHQACDSIHLDDLGVSVHGQSFATRAVRENLSLGYPGPVKGQINLGMLHTCLDGAEGHEPYAPCTANELSMRGYDYWALGHIHQRLVTPLQAQGTPVLFSGNLQGRHIRETGPKGVYLVSIDQGAAKVEFRRLDAYCWELCQVDLSAVTLEDDLLEAFALEVERIGQEHPDRPTAARFEFTGATILHGRLNERIPVLLDQLRSVGIIRGQGRLWIEDFRLRTRPLAQLRETQGIDGPIAYLSSFIERLRKTPEDLVAIAEPLQELARRLPQKNGWENEISPRDSRWLDEVIPEVQSILLERLTRGDGDSA